MAILTPDQLKGKTITRVAPAPTSTAPVAAPKGPDFLQSVASDFKERVNSAADSQVSDQGFGSKVLQTVGQGAGFIGDIGFDAVKAVTPEPIKEAASSAVQAVASTAPAQHIESLVSTWAKAHPEAAKNLESIVNIAGLIPAVKGVSVAEQGVKTAATKTVGAVKDGVEGVGRATSGAVGTVGAKISNAITPMEKGVETVLKSGSNPVEQANLAAKFDKYHKQAEIAVKDYSQPTPLELAGDEGAKALKNLGEKLKVVGEAKRSALGETANKVVNNVGTFRSALRDQLRERVGLNLVVQDGKVVAEEATGRASKIAFDAADNKLVVDAYTALAKLGKKPTVQMLDDTVDSLQDLLYKRKQLGAVPVNGQVESVLKNITRQLNDGVKKVAGPKYSAANAEYSKIKNVFDVLNKSLGQEGNKGAALMKQLFSPSGTAPRKLFQRVKELTGVDLVHEATLAKFVMENIGDVRQASLLEQVLRGHVSPTPTGLIHKAADFIIQKSTDPIKKAKTIMKERSDEL